MLLVAMHRDSLENIWMNNFRNSDFVRDEFIQRKKLKDLFYGSRTSQDHLFKTGFREFKRGCLRNPDPEKLDALVEYLQLLGLTIRKDSLLQAIESGACSLEQIVQKTNSFG